MYQNQLKVSIIRHIKYDLNYTSVTIELLVFQFLIIYYDHKKNRLARSSFLFIKISYALMLLLLLSFIILFRTDRILDPFHNILGDINVAGLF